MRGCGGWNGEVVEGKMGEIYLARVREKAVLVERWQGA